MSDKSKKTKFSDLNFPLLLDGGLSNRLEELGCNLNNPLWTAKVLQDSPELILQTHLDYLEAGAKIITTASYQATISGFAEQGLNKEMAIGLITTSVNLAKEAVETFCRTHPESETPLIAASLGPYGAYLADGSEYRGDYSIGKEELRDFHEEKAILLDHLGVDILAFETIPSQLETRIIVQISQSLETPVWITFSCKDGEHISDGTPITDCINLANFSPHIVAVGVNCTKPQYIASLIKEIKRVSGNKKLVVYPNSGETFDADSKTWSDTAEDSWDVEEWLKLGTDIIGGCCRVGPGQIRDLHRILQEYHKS